MKYLILSFLLIISSTTFADTSGYGCKIGHDYVYTEYLGKAPAYQGQPDIYYFKSNGPVVPLYWGYGCNDCRGYRCGYINVYGATSYYDSTIPPNGGNVSVPAENEFVSQGVQCVIAPYLGAPPVATDTYVYYSYNKTNKCSNNPPTGVPIDDYLFLFSSVFVMFCIYSIRKVYLTNIFVK